MSKNFLVSSCNRRRFLHMAAKTTALLLTAGCTMASPPVVDSGPDAGAETPAAEEAPMAADPLRVALPSAPTQLDPALATTIEGYQAAFTLFDGLVAVDHSLTVQPMLATAWESSSDLRSWTFHLRPGVTFHHGAPFTAADVVYSFQRLLDPSFGSLLQPVLSFINRVEAVADDQVRFRLSAPNVELPFLLGAPQARIVPHDYDGAALASRPSGTGPFRFQEFVPRSHLKFTRNPDYWAADRIRVAEVHHLYMASRAAQVAALHAGEIDFIADVNYQQVAELENDPALTLVEARSGAYQTIVMQVTEKPFTDLRVRQALKYCVDRTQLRQTVLGGRGDLGNDHPVAPISPFWAALPQRQRDVDKARQLLAAAGYANGLQLDLVTSSSRPGMIELALAFRAMAAPAGVDVRVVNVPSDVYWSDYGGKAPFHVGNWGFRPSIDETLMIAYHSSARNNESRWRSKDLDALIEAARRTEAMDKRKELYQQAQQLLMDEGGVIVPYFRPILMAMQKYVHGFTPHPAAWLDFRDVQIIKKNSL